MKYYCQWFLVFVLLLTMDCINPLTYCNRVFLCSISFSNEIPYDTFTNYQQAYQYIAIASYHMTQCHFTSIINIFIVYHTMQLSSYILMGRYLSIFSPISSHSFIYLSTYFLLWSCSHFIILWWNSNFYQYWDGLVMIVLRSYYLLSLCVILK